MAVPSLVFTLVVLVVLVLASSSSSSADSAVGRKSRHPQLLIVSFDGFRYDYLDAYDPPNFRSVAGEGVHAVAGVTPAFPTKTFPNHYTIATGLYPESHGIVDNKMYDPQFDATFTMANTEERWWNYGGTEPIWITARKQGLTSATYFWPGSETNFSGVMPVHWMKYDKNTSFHDRVDGAVRWLSEESIDLVTLYFEQPDSVGHKHGAFSDEVERMVGVMDETLGYLVAKLDESGLSSRDRLNLIVTSDHGMTNVSRDEKDVVLLQDILVADDYKLITQTGPVSSVLPRDMSKAQAVFEKLRDGVKHKHPNFTVYRKEDIPERLHYRNNRRIMPIVVIADEGFVAVRNRTELEHTNIGQHGFDNRLPSMRPIFLASGPSFRRSARIEEAFESVNVYPLMCHLLGIEPRPNNGSLAVLKPYLRESSSAATFATASLTLILLQLLVLLPLVAVKSVKV